MYAASYYCCQMDFQAPCCMCSLLSPFPPCDSTKRGACRTHTVDILQAKAVVALGLLCGCGPLVLSRVCRSRALEKAERLGQGEGCGATAWKAVRRQVATQAAVLVSEAASALQNLQPHMQQTSLAPLEALLCLLRSPSLREGVVSGQFISALSTALPRLVLPRGAGLDDLRTVVVQTLDAITSRGELILRFHVLVLTQLLPALTVTGEYGLLLGLLARYGTDV